MYQKRLTSIYIITLISLISSGFHTESDNKSKHTHVHFQTLTLSHSHSHSHEDTHEQENKKSHDHETCHICSVMHSMDNDARVIFLEVNSSDYTKIDLDYNLNTIYEVLLKSRAPPC